MASYHLQLALLSVILFLIALVTAGSTPQLLTSRYPLNRRGRLKIYNEIGQRDKTLLDYCKTPGELFSMKPDEYLRLVYKEFSEDIDHLKTASSIPDPHI